MRRALVFWLSAVVVGACFAAAAAALLPYEALGLRDEAQRWRAWLLTVWTGGVLGVLFGSAGLLGYGGPLGFREVAEAGSAAQALEARRAARRRVGPGFHGNFAWWLVATGGILIVIYFAGWTVLG